MKWCVCGSVLSLVFTDCYDHGHAVLGFILDFISLICFFVFNLIGNQQHRCLCVNFGMHM